MSILSELGKDRLPGNRKTRYSRKLRELGLCWCGRTTKRSLCDKHLAIQAARMRERNKAVL